MLYYIYTPPPTVRNLLEVWIKTLPCGIFVHFLCFQLTVCPDPLYLSSTYSAPFPQETTSPSSWMSLFSAQPPPWPMYFRLPYQFSQSLTHCVMYLLVLVSIYSCWKTSSAKTGHFILSASVSQVPKACLTFKTKVCWTESWLTLLAPADTLLILL